MSLVPHYCKVRAFRVRRIPHCATRRRIHPAFSTYVHLRWMLLFVSFPPLRLFRSKQLALDTSSSPFRFFLLSLLDHCTGVYCLLGHLGASTPFLRQYFPASTNGFGPMSGRLRDVFPASIFHVISSAFIPSIKTSIYGTLDANWCVNPCGTYLLSFTPVLPSRLKHHSPTVRQARATCL